MLVLLTILTSIVTLSSLVCSFVPLKYIPKDYRKYLKYSALNFNNVHYDCNHEEG
jgi:hypothetical protein